MKIYKNIFEQIISSENLFLAWDKFKKGKTGKSDILAYKWNLESNIFKLNNELRTKKYRHGAYTSFYVHDPKQRHIHKASVDDRILHHAIFSVLNPIFEPTFIDNSFSCRIDKGTYKGVKVLGEMLRRVSKNSNIPCFALKCDIKKFFDSVDHIVLKNIFSKRIIDNNVLWLVNGIIDSHSSNRSTALRRKGMPIGNLTSQLFANVYMNEFDQFMKHKLKAKNYLRYTDDFVIISSSIFYLKKLLPIVNIYLKERLKLDLHPRKIIIKKFKQGVDFLGYVSLPHCRLVRNKTNKRIFRKVKEKINEYKDNKIPIEKVNQSIN